MGDVIELRMKSRESLTIQAALDSAEGRGMVSWLEFDRNAFKGNVRALPTKDEIGIPVNEQVVVELYSR